MNQWSQKTMGKYPLFILIIRSFFVDYFLLVRSWLYLSADILGFMLIYNSLKFPSIYFPLSITKNWARAFGVMSTICWVVATTDRVSDLTQPWPAQCLRLVFTSAQPLPLSQLSCPGGRLCKPNTSSTLWLWYYFRLISWSGSYWRLPCLWLLSLWTKDTPYGPDFRRTCEPVITVLWWGLHLRIEQLIEGNFLSVI